MMHKQISCSSGSRYLVILVALISLIILYQKVILTGKSSSLFIANASKLPKSSYFNYSNLSTHVHLSETSGILFVPPMDQPAHFASIQRNAVRGNHRHVGTDQNILGEVIVLLHGKFQIRIGDGDTNEFEDYEFDISKVGILGIVFNANVCHSVKNIGYETNWFASYYIKSKDSLRAPPVDRIGCRRIQLT